MSFLLFRSILRPASKDPEAHEGVGENRANGHGHEFGGIAPQRGIRNQRLQRQRQRSHGLRLWIACISLSAGLMIRCERKLLRPGKR